MRKLKHVLYVCFCRLMIHYYLVQEILIHSVIFYHRQFYWDKKKVWKITALKKVGFYNILFVVKQHEKCLKFKLSDIIHFCQLYLVLINIYILILPIKDCVLMKNKWAASWQNQHSSFATSMNPDQSVHPRSLIRIHAVRYQFLYL
jgi:hypothetical protein